MSYLAYRNGPAGGGDSTGSADGAGTGLWRLGVWCKESMPQHVLKRTQRTHTCLCGLKAHYGCVGEYDEGEGETDRGWRADWSWADTAVGSERETAFGLVRNVSYEYATQESQEQTRTLSPLPNTSHTLSASAGQWHVSLHSDPCTTLNPWLYSAACPNLRFRSTILSLYL